MKYCKLLTRITRITFFLLTNKFNDNKLKIHITTLTESLNWLIPVYYDPNSSKCVIAILLEGKKEVKGIDYEITCMSISLKWE